MRRRGTEFCEDEGGNRGNKKGVRQGGRRRGGKTLKKEVREARRKGVRLMVDGCEKRVRKGGNEGRKEE